MKINIFSIPIFLGNIDVKKIKIENQTYKKNWTSETLSSYKSPNISLDEKSTFLKHRVDKNNFSGETISGNVKITLKNE